MIDGLYVHIPFCSHICYYCDFGKSRYNESLCNNYLQHLENELSSLRQDSFSSIYLGGGSPTALNEEQLERLLHMLNRYKVEKEYVIEINPENFTFDKAKLLKQYGINRVSIGIQSFNEDLLKHMGRVHTNQDVVNTMDYLDAVGINNRSMDLMFGFRNQQVGELLVDLKKAVCMPVTHISIYDLEVYDKTPFGFQHYQKADDEITYQMYAATIDFLNDHSYKQYETSNFAIPGYESQHNLLYWHYKDYYGAGLAASGKIGDERYDNTRNFVDYLKDNYRKEVIRLSLDDQRFEAIMMNLRLLEGIDINEFDHRFECNLLEKYHVAVEKNLNRGLLEIKNGFLKVTQKGIFVLNDILVDFMN